MVPAAIRDLAYGVVKKMKKAWTADGCDIQIAVEAALVEQHKKFRDLVEKRRKEWDHLDAAESALRSLRDELDGVLVVHYEEV